MEPTFRDLLYALKFNVEDFYFDAVDKIRRAWASTWLITGSTALVLCVFIGSGPKSVRRLVEKFK